MANISKKFQRNHYDKLSEGRQKSRLPFSCGFDERYDPFLLVNNKQAYQYFCDLLAEKITERKMTVLDCCSGSGIYLPVIAKFCELLIGIDISYGLLKESKRIFEIVDSSKTFIMQSEAESISMKDDSCDMIVMIDSFHHIESPRNVLKELSRIAKKDAVFLLIEPNINNPLVFISHLIPREERGAIARNTSKKLKQLLSPYLYDIQITGINYVASNKAGWIGKLVTKITALLFAHVFSFWPIRLFILGRFKKEA